MKRFHVHVAVSDLKQSTQFYSAMFGMQPTVQKDDYAKWMLDDPRVNFAISERANASGLNHLGFQADSDEELEEIHARLQTADTAITAEKGANCCYAKSDKYWVQDPSGIPWESFRSLDTIPFYGENSHKGGAGAENATAASEGGACGTSCCPAPVAKAATTAKACCNG
ncbi:MAG: VOC family protein [Betaproteobacteria bacterium]|nr:VOC family protein [Betaproteobacteria bacterium]